MIWLAALAAVISGVLWVLVHRRAGARIAASGPQQFGGPAADMLLSAAAISLSAATVVLAVLSIPSP